MDLGKSDCFWTKVVVITRVQLHKRVCFCAALKSLSGKYVRKVASLVWPDCGARALVLQVIMPCAEESLAT